MVPPSEITCWATAWLDLREPGLSAWAKTRPGGEPHRGGQQFNQVLVTQLEQSDAATCFFQLVQ